MAQTYDFKTSDGATRVPVANASHIVEIGRVHDQAQVHIRCLDAQGDPVTPTGGTITFHGNILDGVWLAPSQGESIDATQLVAGNVPSAYEMPAFNGGVQRIRATFNGITGATSVQMLVWAGGD